MEREISKRLAQKSEKGRIKAITHIEDVDGVVCGALILKKFPNAELEGGLPRPESFDKKYDFITDLPLPDGVETTVWIDHHSETSKKGKSEEKIYDPSAESASGLVAEYLDIEGDELVPLADRADSASYLTQTPMSGEEDYDTAWDVNDSVKAIESEKRFVKLARTLASEGVKGVKEKFKDEISRTRELRKKADDIYKVISRKLKGMSIDAPLIISPDEKLNNLTVWGHIVFSLYDEGVKACAIFYDDRCWLNARNDFDGIDAGSIMSKHGGGGHEKSAGAPISSNKAEAVKEELKGAGLTPQIIDLREKFWKEKIQVL